MDGTRNLDASLLALARSIAVDDRANTAHMLVIAPELAKASFTAGASRQEAERHFLEDFQSYYYEGDTALHLAALAYRTEIARELVGLGADVRARNRRGAEPLHAAAVGSPGSRLWAPAAQATTIAYLLQAGADPNAIDKSGVAPLHRAVRNRCASAVKALLDGGADARLPNRNGSTPILLARLNTGRSGSRSHAAKAQQAEILSLLEARLGEE